MQDLGVAGFNPVQAKRRRVEVDVEVTEEGVMEMLVRYDRRDFLQDKTPKTVLYHHTL